MVRHGHGPCSRTTNPSVFFTLALLLREFRSVLIQRAAAGLHADAAVLHGHGHGADLEDLRHEMHGGELDEGAVRPRVLLHGVLADLIQRTCAMRLGVRAGSRK